MATPPVVEPCTACDEAKYEVQYFIVPRCLIISIIVGEVRYFDLLTILTI